MKRNLFILIILTAFMVSCNHDKVFEKYEKMNDNKWLKSQSLTFEVPIEDTSSVYDISLTVRHADYYTYANILVTIDQVTPVGEERYKNFDLRLRKNDGSFIGDGSGDIWDTKILVYKKMSFNNKGTYKFVVENHMPYVETEGIMEIGFVVEKAKD
jgi:gliding motility-associated lipoprotein GldH